MLALGSSLLARSSGRVPRRVAVTGALVGVAVAQALLLGRLLHVDPFFDEGTYLVSLDAIRHGAAIGRDVFTSQPPVFYDLLHVLSFVFPSTLAGIRAAIVATSLVAIPGAYLAGRALVGRFAGICACALLTVGPPFPIDGARIFADTPALALSTLSVGCAAVGAGWAAGAVLALAVLTKFSALTAAPCVAALLVLRPPRRRRLAEATVAALVVGAVVALVHLNGLGGIWHDAVAYHETASAGPGALSNGHALAHYFNPRTPFLWLELAGALGTVLAPRRAAVLWLWPATAALFVLTHTPLHENHLLTLPFAFAVAAGAGLGGAVQRLPRGRSAAGLLVLVVLAAGYVQQLHNVDRSRLPVEPRFVAAARVVRSLTPAGSYIASDQPYVAVLAHRHVPPDLVDTADLRFATGYLTPASVERSIATYRVRVVVVGRAFRGRPVLMRWIESHARRVAAFDNVWVYRMNGD